MFAFLALAGDVGCAGGPTFAGKIASMLGDNLKMGILAATVFPITLIITLIIMNLHKKVCTTRNICDIILNINKL